MSLDYIFTYLITTGGHGTILSFEDINMNRHGACPQEDPKAHAAFFRQVTVIGVYLLPVLLPLQVN